MKSPLQARVKGGALVHSPLGRSPRFLFSFLINLLLFNSTTTRKAEVVLSAVSLLCALSTMEAVVAEQLVLLAAAEVHAGAEQLVLLAIRTTAGSETFRCLPPPYRPNCTVSPTLHDAPQNHFDLSAAVADLGA